MTRSRAVSRVAVALVATFLACAPVVVSAQEFARRYALLFAVDEYAARDVPRLEFAERDAEKLAERLKAQGYEITPLLGPNATRSRVIRELLRAQETLRPQDSFVLYYAGHGVRRDSNGQVYWLNYDGDPQRPDIEGLRLRHLIELVHEIPAGRKLVLLDHCYAGDVTQRAVIGDGGRDTPLVSPLLAQPREAFPLEFERDIVQARAAGAGDKTMFVVAASRGVALEDPALMHGFFTAVLLAALRGPDADTAGADGALSMFELMNYVEQQVTLLSGSRQKPFVLPPEGGSLTAGLNWQPFIRSLTATEIAQRQQRYVDRLRQWTNQQLMTPEVQTLCEQLLQRWQAAPAALSPTDEQAIAELRVLIDTPPVLDDARVAAELARRMRFLLEP